MDALHIMAVRLAPVLASGLVSIGVANNHAEVIALGVATGIAVAVEGFVKWRKQRKAKEQG